MKKLIALTLTALACLPALAAEPAVITVKLVNPVGVRWVVEKDGEEIWLANPPAKECAPLIAKMKQHQQMQARLDSMLHEETTLEREWDRLAELVPTATDDGYRAISVRRAQINSRLNELRRQARQHLQQFNVFLKANGGGDKVARPAIKIVARDSAQRQHNRAIWQHLRFAPKDPEPKDE